MKKDNDLLFSACVFVGCGATEAFGPIAGVIGCLATGILCEHEYPGGDDDSKSRGGKGGDDDEGEGGDDDEGEGGGDDEGEGGGGKASGDA